jgi:hypothetical protein
MYFSKSSFTVGIVGLVAIYRLGLLIYVYFQGGVDSAIHLGGW